MIRGRKFRLRIFFEKKEGLMAESGEMWDFAERTSLLLGEDALESLRSARVLVLGCGGVGGAAAEMLVRAGIGTLMIMDGDRVELSNLNRQFAARRSTLGMLKTDAMRVLLQDINPGLNLVTADRFLKPGEAAELLRQEKPDFAVDAIDDVPAKTDFILTALEQKIPFISAMGAGGRLNPETVRECDISKTCQCGLARAVRTRLREHNVHSGVRVVFSPEAPVKTPGTVGTVSYMPALFGLFCASAAIRFLVSRGK